MFSFNKYLLYFRPSTQLMVLSILFFMALTLGGLLTEQLNQFWIGKELKEIAKLSSDSYTIQLSKWLNALSIVMAFLLPAALFAYLAYPKPFEYLRLSKPFGIKHLGLALPLLFLSIPASDWLQYLSGQIQTPKSLIELDKLINDYTMTLLGAKKLSSYLVSLVAICLIPAMVEELFFRGVLQQILHTWMKEKPWLPILIAAITFSLMHSHVAGFLSRTLLGFLLGLTFYVSGNIWLSILLHFINNATAVTLSYLYQSGVIRIDFSTFQTPPLVAILCLLIALVGMYYLYLIRAPFQYLNLNESFEPQNTSDYE